jgi:hypothetical protein
MTVWAMMIWHNTKTSLNESIIDSATTQQPTPTFYKDQQKTPTPFL